MKRSASALEDSQANQAIKVYHIPVCPFSQRLEILLSLKGKQNDVQFEKVDITKPRDKELLKLTGGSTALPVLITHDGKVIKESLVIMQYLEDIFNEKSIAQSDPYKHAVENMLTAFENKFVVGYSYLMNQNIEQRNAFHDKMLQEYARLNSFLEEHSPDGTFLFDEFGWAECVYTPFFMRFCSFLEYYEGFELPSTKEYARVAKWQKACLDHPAAQQVTKEEIVKVYYDFAKGAGNGSLVAGRELSSFVFEPDWSTRPWPPKDKYGHSASDEELGLLQ